MAKDLVTNILINARTTEGFNNIAARLARMGQQINVISSRVLEFEKESVNIYRSYEDNMLAAEFALSAQYKSATKLAQVMDGLDIAATEWAESTKFHTDDVSKAINIAAHAGWNYEQILIGIPEAMKIAQAGGLELSDGLDFLIKILNSTNTEFKDSGRVVDQWAKAANLSATNIEEIGQAFIALGASATFADSTQELFTLMAILADTGATGSKAGTLLRNAMLRVVAPTTKAEAAMSLFGADIDEINSVLDDTNVTKAAKLLEGAGFSAYDAQGNLKSMKTIFTEMHQALKNLEEDSQFEILSAIFPQRAISASLAFLDAVANGEMDEIFKSIGDSEGYAAEGAEIMMSGLTGAITRLSSKWEKFQEELGKTLAPGVESMAEWLGHIVDWLNDLDEPTMSAIAGALTAMAAAGPGMLVTGAAVLLLTSAPGKILFAAAAVGALAGYLSKISEMKFESMFGNVKVNLSSVLDEIGKVGTQFDEDQKVLQQWEDKVNEAALLYQEKSTEMSELLLTDVLSGKSLTDTEKNNLVKYAESIGGALTEGLRNSRASTMSFLQLMFGDENKDAQTYLTTTDVVMAYFEDSIGQATQLGQELRDQMVAALADDKLDETELKAIQATQARMNQIMAEIAALTDSEGYYVQLSKSQRVSFDTIEQFVADNTAAMNAEIDSINAQYDKQVGVIGAAYDWALKKGLKTFTVNGIEYAVTEADRDAAMAEIERERAERVAEVENKYQEPIRRARQTLIDQSDFSQAWDFLTAHMDENGNLDLKDAFAGMDYNEIMSLSKQFDWLIQNGSKFKSRLLYEKGSAEDSYFDLITMAAALAGTSAGAWLQELAFGGGDSVQTIADMESDAKAQVQPDIDAQIARLIAQRAEIQQRYDEAYNRYYNWEGRGFMYQPGTDKANLALYEKQLAEIDSQLAALNGTVTMTVDQTAVDEWVAPEKTGTVVYEPVIADSVLNGGKGGNNIAFDKKANGGRATTPSIFVDAGAEWAIPEKHSERTADLLNMAREASGFTWGDLIARYGGLNAGNGSGVTLNYQPVINGGDGASISDALARDRDGLVKLIRKALDEARYRDTVAVYA